MEGVWIGGGHRSTTRAAHGLRNQREPSCLELRHVEDVADRPDHLRAGLLDPLDIALLPLGERLFGSAQLEQLPRRLDQCEGPPQAMDQHGGEGCPEVLHLLITGTSSGGGKAKRPDRQRSAEEPFAKNRQGLN